MKKTEAIRIAELQLQDTLIKTTLGNPVIVFASIYLLADYLVKHGYMYNSSGQALTLGVGAVSLAQAIAPAVGSGANLVDSMTKLIPLGSVAKLATGV